ncbi:hypothetical protein R1538_34565 [Rhizobium leguminosarum]|uniref:hypothetical protein n=1 Tax=Rhizobium leguminosarum TaxID=384 RepID=UPI00293DD51B|nr:hypothetical protein [Rhizobium leguminosarum]MDV4166175.1 hypothetical protein [Rhizobium leguminosarum]
MLRWPKSYDAGTEIRGSKGDLVATIIEDAHKDSVMHPEQFILPDGQHPLADSVMPQEVLEFFRRDVL